MSFSSSSSPEITPACRADSPQHEYEYKTQEDVLEDLSSRFILNLPEEELTSLERISFQIEQAHWFYEDFIREQNPKFPSLPLKKFSAMLFEQCPMLHHFQTDHDQAFHNFMLYKTRVPVCGAIMLNETWEKCLLVKGWKSSSGWGFPKGKINEGEPQSSCAVREVLEETGYNLAGQVNPADVIEMVIKEQKIVLYIVPGVPEDFPFKTKTRKEISKIEWFKLTDLPTWKRQKAAAGKFYLITPFIGALKTWINEKKHTARPRKHPRSKRTNGRSRQNSVSDYPYHPAQDVLQESSSQSSSADNGEPETPSPEHPQAVANHVNVSTEVLDPHFARLLSSLALSEQVTQKKDKPVHSVVPEGEGPPERNTPVPAVPLVKPQHQPTKSRPSTTQPPKAQPPALQSPKPQPLFSEIEQPNGLNFGKETSRPVVSPLQAKSITYQPSSSPVTSLPDPPHSARKSSISTASTSSPTAPTASPRVSRRTSSIADISPYLSKAPEIPASAKRWKELALLESVADESARMTNFIRNTPTPSPSLPMMAPSNGLPMPYSMQGQGPISVLPPSASVPPHQFQGRMDAGALYSSSQVMRPGTSVPHLPPITNMPNVPLPYPQFDDPFKVRPRTSQAVNRAYPPMGPSSMSMTQNQLASLMNLPQGAPNLPNFPPHPAPIPPPLNASYRFPPNHAINPVLPMAGPAPQRQGPFPLSVYPQPLSVIPPGGSFTPGPLSAPAISPRFDMMPNNPLLSILNGNNQGLSGASITRPM